MAHPAARHRPRVFISYTRESEEHDRRVAELCSRLRRDGVECHIDQHESSPEGGWPRWMERQIREADFVLVVCTETYERRLNLEEEPGRGLGATWESGLIMQQAYEGAGAKCIPVVFDAADVSHIPLWLRARTWYVLGSDREYARLYRHLTGDALEERRAAVDYSQLVQANELPAEDDAEFYAVAFSPDGRRVAAGSEQRILLWDLEHERPRPRSIVGHKSYVYSVAFSPDGELLASGGEDGSVRVFEVATRRPRWTQVPRPAKTNAHRDAVYSVAFSRDGERLASGGYDRVVNLWDAAGIFRNRIDVSGRVTSVAFSPDKPLLAIGSLDDRVTVRNLRTGEEAVLTRHTSSVETVAFSADGRWLASSGLDKTVRLWDVSVWPPTERWARRDHDYLVRSVAFSPDSATLASASWDKTVKIWDVETSEPTTLPTEPRRHTDWIWSVAFSRDGPMRLATGGSDGRIILWTVREPADEQRLPAAAAS